MKASVISAFSALLVGLVAAAPLEKREYAFTTVTEEVIETVDVTVTVTVDPASTGSYSWSWSHAATTTPSSSATTSSTTSETPVHTPQEQQQPSQETPEPAPTTTSSPPPPSTTEAPATTEAAYVQPPSEPVKEPVKEPVNEPVKEPVKEPEPAVQAPTEQAYVAPPQQDIQSSSYSVNDGNKGEVTFYDAGLGACGWTNDGSSENVVALAHGYMGEQSNGNPHCGKMMEVTCNGKSVMAKVVDKCMGCSGMDIDLSRSAFGQIADFGAGRLKSGCSWRWA